jgi:hypothetical protein
MIAAELRGLVDRFRAEARPPLDRYAIAVLARLVSEDCRHLVLPAFRVVPREGWWLLIRDCVRAEETTRNHRAIVKSFSAKIDDALVALQHCEAIAAYLRRHCGGDDPAREKLTGLMAVIERDRCDAERFLSWRSRKTDTNARLSAGVGWLKESIHKATGKANRKIVADLAVVVLDARDIDEVVVKHALTPSEHLHQGMDAFAVQKRARTRPSPRRAEH